MPCLAEVEVDEVGPAVLPQASVEYPVPPSVVVAKTGDGPSEYVRYCRLPSSIGIFVHEDSTYRLVDASGSGPDSFNALSMSFVALIRFGNLTSG